LRQRIRLRTGERVISESTVEAVGAQRHIIKRPRLTRLLDETTARIILLVAPAGYGKTTLAREWCEAREGRTAWYQAGTSATDVAALAADLSRVVGEIVPSAEQTLRSYLRAQEAHEVNLAALARLLGEHVAEWPADAVLVIDDYHCVVDAVSSDRLVGLLVEHTPLRLLLASRRDPHWMSAKHFIYGDLLKLNRADLAMTRAEVEQILPRDHPNLIPSWTSRIDGWPALIGLAARTSTTLPPPAAVAEALHTFFAQELFDATAPELRVAFIKLALLPILTPSLAREALNEDPSLVLQEGARTGFLTYENAHTYTLHPLLREFLLSKTSLLASEELSQLTNRIVDSLISCEQWDHAFTFIHERAASASLPRLLHVSLDHLLREGRVATVSQWLEFARRFHVRGPMVDVAEAECALRMGDVRKAVFFSRRAARNVSPRDPNRFRLLALAGLASHLVDEYSSALQYYERAQSVASNAAELRNALWGRFTSTHHSEAFGCEAILDELESIDEDQTPDDLVRIANGYFRTTCLGCTSLHESLDRLIKAYPLIKIATDPHVICGFFGVYAQCLMLTARYKEAMVAVAEAKSAAVHYGLVFTLPYFTAMEAFALFGLGQLEDASVAVTRLTEEAEDLDDSHSLANARVAGARIALARGDVSGAIEMTDERGPHAVPPPMRGEYLAVHALALACAGAVEAAEAGVKRARSASRALETETSAKAAEAIISLLQDGGRRDPVGSLLGHLERTQHFDAFVAAYRGNPPLLRECAAPPRYRSLIDHTLTVAQDIDFAGRLGVRLSSGRRSKLLGGACNLSPREEEVLRLISVGLSNAAIANQLYISESTVKVHVRHILEKLGARSRTEAAMKFVYHQPYAGASN
jgi:LuxR family transcriptional regulator, maltose regulon positive regulatory protein